MGLVQAKMFKHKILQMVENLLAFNIIIPCKKKIYLNCLLNLYLLVCMSLLKISLNFS